MGVRTLFKVYVYCAIRQYDVFALSFLGHLRLPSKIQIVLTIFMYEEYISYMLLGPDLLVLLHTTTTEYHSMIASTGHHFLARGL